MPIVPIILVLCLFGFLVYMLRSAPLPIDPWVKSLIIGIVCFALVIWLLNAFGINTGIHFRLT